MNRTLQQRRSRFTSSPDLAPATPALQDCIARHQAVVPGLAELGASLAASHDASALDALIDLYEQCTPLLEKAMWSGEADFHPLLASYQALFREQEALIRQRCEHDQTRDDRHRFILSIPVADRPPHLRACLESIYQVCTLFDYGGHASGVWDKIQVVVSEDSRDEANVRRHIELVEEYRQKGLQVVHFCLDEQYALLHTLPPHTRERLGKLLTTQPRDRFYLKGQAANRNLSYLKCLQLTADTRNTLYYLIDSDQSLCVNRQTASGEEAVVALNYFHAIDKIFRTTDTLMLTGKMVGDPPVSPAVMAANFLDDVTAFFTRLATLPAEQACQFHDLPRQPVGDAAYHDMARLFGFENQPATFPYACRLAGAHDHHACLADFAQRLNAFFFGEHLTRKTRFAYGSGFTELAPARTVYPGNYIVNHAGLKYVIPFGHLRLRMSGPTAGRLIAAEIKERFASFNMPNLHRRTTEAGPGDDFRPGVDVGEASVDVSNEFERQFFGDLMLFSTEALVKQADVTQPFAQNVIEAVVAQKEAELLALYQQKHDAIAERNRQLNDLVFNAGHWWLHAAEHAPGLAHALRQVRAFIDNIDRNFGEQALAWRQIQSAEHRARRKRQIVEALMNYRAERDAWDSLF
ncbi:MAG: hypothetical protein KKA22_01900 [Gammaproteobacteria bacterium]|nr:hypothetical protein [Gammaproteobacteria bacterium]MBU1406882.1 hypothetical protein [Gammaproteobacteria bacterium]MBU1533025.1 hypothetical protein [Gammaproteobacteria bacterium]